jgi:hypothetical protein
MIATRKIDTQTIIENMPYYFVKTDGGKSLSKYPKIKNDCVIRALAIFYNLPYDTILERHKGAMHGKGLYFEYIAKNEPYNLKWKAFQAVKGQPRMNMTSFGQIYPKGRFIAKEGHHAFCIIDGTRYDTGKSYDSRCIYGAWAETWPMTFEERSKLDLLGQEY